MNTTCVVCQQTYSDLANELNVQEICTECEKAGWIEAPEPPQSRRFVIEVEVEGPNEPFLRGYLSTALPGLARITAVHSITAASIQNRVEGGRVQRVVAGEAAPGAWEDTAVRQAVQAVIKGDDR